MVTSMSSNSLLISSRLKVAQATQAVHIMKNTLRFMHSFVKVNRWTSRKRNLPNTKGQNLLFLLFRISLVRPMSSWTFYPGVTGQLIRRYTMGNCMLLS